MEAFLTLFVAGLCSSGLGYILCFVKHSFGTEREPATRTGAEWV